MNIVDGKDHIQAVKALIIEYITHLNRDLDFQNIQQELENPAEKYTAPNGEILVALDEQGVAMGIVAYRKHSQQRCEMKRLYVSPAFRGQNLGRKLTEEIILHATEAGFAEMVLDTVQPLKAAIHLYKKLGFVECAPYYHNPMSDVIYMRLPLE